MSCGDVSYGYNFKPQFIQKSMYNDTINYGSYPSRNPIVSNNKVYQQSYNDTLNEYNEEKSHNPTIPSSNQVPINKISSLSPYATEFNPTKRKTSLLNLNTKSTESFNCSDQIDPNDDLCRSSNQSINTCEENLVNQNVQPTILYNASIPISYLGNIAQPTGELNAPIIVKYGTPLNYSNDETVRYNQAVPVNYGIQPTPIIQVGRGDINQLVPVSYGNSMSPNIIPTVSYNPPISVEYDQSVSSLVQPTGQYNPPIIINYGGAVSQNAPQPIQYGASVPVSYGIPVRPIIQPTRNYNPPILVSCSGPLGPTGEQTPIYNQPIPVSLAVPTSGIVRVSGDVNQSAPVNYGNSINSPILVRCTSPFISNIEDTYNATAPVNYGFPSHSAILVNDDLEQSISVNYNNSANDFDRQSEEYVPTELIDYELTEDEQINSSVTENYETALSSNFESTKECLSTIEDIYENQTFYNIDNSSESLNFGEQIDSINESTDNINDMFQVGESLSGFDASSSIIGEPLEFESEAKLLNSQPIINVDEQKKSVAPQQPMITTNPLGLSAALTTVYQVPEHNSQSTPCGELFNQDESYDFYNPLFKTELCSAFSSNGGCYFGDNCVFAHGLEELRPIVRHPKYKTQYCRSFHVTGFCRYGKRCNYIHNVTDPQIWKQNKIRHPRIFCPDCGIFIRCESDTDSDSDNEIFEDNVRLIPGYEESSSDKIYVPSLNALVDTKKIDIIRSIMRNDVDPTHCVGADKCNRRQDTENCKQYSTTLIHFHDEDFPLIEDSERIARMKRSRKMHSTAKKVRNSK